jgi:mannose-1-phosphate guanylyltransferase
MADNHNHALILAGGRGTRFWPKSRKARAKQVIEFFGQGTMIQQTVARLRQAVPPDRIWVMTNPLLRDEIASQLPDVPKRQILAEPVQRNTAPAIGLAAHILRSIDPAAVMGVFHSDHFIEREKPFLKTVQAAYQTAAKGQIALIGIEPRWPETGYGYIEFAPGAMSPGSVVPAKVTGFREKPDLALAKRFVRAGNFCWNAGMFFWRAETYLAQLRLHLPATAALIDSLPAFSSRTFGKAVETVFPQCENISVDYAVLEKAEGVAGFVAGDIGWNDVGSWNAVYELLQRDDDGNGVRADAVLMESRGNMVASDSGRLVALLGVNDLIVVDTPDALLVAHKDMAQRVGDLVKELEALHRDELL